MTSPIEERLAQLKADVADLEITVEERKIAYDKVQEMWQIIGKLDITDRKNNEVLRGFAEKFIQAELDYLRDKITILRKVSPKSSNLLEKKVNDYEKTSLDIFELWKKYEPQDLSNLSIWGNITRIIGVMMAYHNLHDLIDTAYNGFKDTVEFLEGTKKSENS